MKKYEAEYKREVCKRIVEKGESTAQVARELGISVDTVYTWVSRYRQSGDDSFPGSGNLRPEDAEMRRLQRENRELREENEILKKAAAYFAKNQK
jgi:transposase